MEKNQIKHLYYLKQKICTNSCVKIYFESTELFIEYNKNLHSLIIKTHITYFNKKIINTAVK